MLHVCLHALRNCEIAYMHCDLVLHIQYPSNLTFTNNTFVGCCFLQQQQQRNAV